VAKYRSGGLIMFGRLSAFWWKLWLVIKVIQARLRFVAILAAVGAVILCWPRLEAVYEKSTRPLLGKQAVTASDVEYWCPMHPTVVQDKPGKCPICGMPLSKRKKNVRIEGVSIPAGAVSRVQLTPYREAIAGIRTEAITYRALSREIRTVGFVEFDEQKLARINSWVKGKNRIDKLYANVTGQTVKKGEPLAELYSPEFVITAQSLLDAHRDGNHDLEQSSRKRLRLWGIQDDQIDAILQNGKPVTHVTIRSPIRGHIIRKYHQEGDYVEEGSRLYDVADLSTVWIEAQVYEDEIGLLKEGMEVRATTKAFPNREFTGQVSLIHPHLDAATRTLRVRFEMANPHHELRPGMDATVILQAPATQTVPRPTDQRSQEVYDRGEVLAVPERAVIDTGTRKLVYRETVPDIYDGIEVELGSRCGAYYPVVHGLLAGDRVATAGSFLIDAEARLTPGLGSTFFGATGTLADEHHQAATVRPSATRSKDDKARANLAKLNAAMRERAEAQKTCPVSGQPLGSMGTPISITLKGKTFFLCCDGCREEATTHLAKTLERLKEVTHGGPHHD
jgi:membrane fusion protein, copper/silver efflux system